MKKTVVAAALALLSLTPGTAHAAERTVDGVALGIIGNYDDADLTRLHDSGGAADALVELSWAQAEPVEGRYDEAYLTSVRTRIATLRAMGYTISFNTGLHEAPAWLLAKPGARYVDQHGRAYTDSPEPNLVFGKNLRPTAQRYLKKIFASFGTDFSLVRVGGGHWGELTYPFQVDPRTGRLRNLYYAFDVNAKKTNPAPRWLPGQQSANGQAGRFLTWYLNSLAGYQNWQIAALRTAGYQGRTAVLYPSWGMRTGDFERAVATNLAGTSSPEINGEVQRGYDAARQIRALKDRNTAVYGTWGENNDTVAYLAGLARAKGLPAMAETSHVCTPEQLPTVMEQAAQNKLAALYVVRLGADDIIGSAPHLTTTR